MKRHLLTAALALLPAIGIPAEAVFTLVIQDHRFTPEELVVPAGKKVRLIVENRDTAPEEFESKALKIEKIVPANSEASITLRPLKAGRYKFVGEFHEDTAKGEIVVE